jgi:hypothetical protein
VAEREIHASDATSSHWQWSLHDWKGWLALAWVLWWGFAYVLTVLEARAPHLLVWLRSWANGDL